MIEDTNLLTGDDNLNLAKDTFYLRCFSEFQQPLNSNGVSVGVLGNMTDPNFGKTFAGFYTQCRLSANNVSFGTGAVLDSAVITFAYNGKYGKFDQPVNLAVYELNQDLVDSLTYKTTDAFSVNIPPVGTLNSFVPNTTDSIHVYGVSYPAHLRIPLTNSFANKILLADSSYLVDNTSFLALLKGLYVTTASNPTGNGLLYLTLASPLSKITLYYHNADEDSLSYDIPVSGVRVNHFDNIYTGSPVYTSVNSPNVNGETKMYVQGGAGVKGKIQFPDLDSLPKKISINKAELILSQSAGDTAYSAPLVLDLFRIDETGTAQKLEDDGLAHFGGIRVTESVDGESIIRYKFNIKKYFQKLIEGKYPNNGFYLQILGANSNTERAVIANSSTDEKYKITLVVTYTKL
ncbi:MAG: DUF4270 domain-containing protein [Chitinophagales bacterium]|nr:DUF4270 domain-containing protein [Chitinophagales bacterium]